MGCGQTGQANLSPFAALNTSLEIMLLGGIDMNVARTGIILNTERYEECVAFYRELFGLEIMHQKSDGDFKLTSFHFGGAYLMVETEGVAKDGEKEMAENPTKLRFNVTDIREALSAVQAYGIAAKIESYDWGNTINICDPDGNRVGIRDEATFE
jgi:lactoylglutathione lyase